MDLQCFKLGNLHLVRFCAGVLLSRQVHGLRADRSTICGVHHVNGQAPVLLEDARLRYREAPLQRAPYLTPGYRVRDRPVDDRHGAPRLRGGISLREFSAEMDGLSIAPGCALQSEGAG